MVKELKLKNFMGLTELEITDFGRVNLILGANDTGKSGIMKFLYAVLKSVDECGRIADKIDVVVGVTRIDRKLSTVFELMNGNLRDLRNKKIKTDSFEGKFKLSNAIGDFALSLELIFFDASIGWTENTLSEFPKIQFDSVYIPPRDILDMLGLVKGTRDYWKVPGFGDTYQDLATYLLLPPATELEPRMEAVLKSIECIISGKVEQKGSEYIYKKGEIEIPIRLASEGVRKIGVLANLIKRRVINENSVLFFDEPENSLHPKALLLLLQALNELAKAGVQVFIASHSVFVLKQLDIFARQANAEKIMCHVLSKDANELVTCKSYNLENEFPENSIWEAFDDLTVQEFKLD
ncbi:MAG: AAA family ATPase [Bacteroidota bacterium]